MFLFEGPGIYIATLYIYMGMCEDRRARFGVVATWFPSGFRFNFTRQRLKWLTHPYQCWPPFQGTTGRFTESLVPRRELGKRLRPQSQQPAESLKDIDG